MRQLGLIGLWCLIALAPAAGFAKCSGPVGGKEGDCAPDFTLESIDGKSVQLSQLQGKVVFLNFWATWCEPCKVEVPSMVEAYAKLEGPKFVMLAVSIDSEGKKAIQKFFGAKDPPFPTLLDRDQKISRMYGTFKVPETYIIDIGGKIRDKIEGPRDWNDSMLIHYFQLLSHG